MLRLFIGFDEVETVAYHAMVQSIINTCSVPIAITPLKLSMLPEYTRERDPKQSNEFSFSRFLVPYLCGYEGHAIFMDLDMLVRADLNELWKLRDDTKSVQVVKHDYTPKNQTKYLGAIQYQYPRKNWSSVMLFNCGHDHCKRLTPEYINTTSGLGLHRFYWTHEDYIGELSEDWNHLVGEYKLNPNAKNVHFTCGGPWFNEYRDVEHSCEWRDIYDDMTHSDQLSKVKYA
jgi:lipopolysaccharide biosynthesis glycosyltransferase